MAGMNDINVAFKQAAGDKVSLIQGRMSYGPDGEHVLEFDVNHDGVAHTLREVVQKGGDANALVAGALRVGTRARMMPAGGEIAQQSEPIAQEPDEARNNAIEKIKAGEYELAPTEEAKPPIFF